MRLLETHQPHFSWALNLVTWHWTCRNIALLSWNRDKSHSMDILPPNHCLPFLISTDKDPNNCICEDSATKQTLRLSNPI